MIDSCEKPKKIAIVVTSVLMVKFFLASHIASLSKNYEITLILKNDFPDILQGMNLPVKIIEIPIERKISIFRDFCALIILIKILYKEKFNLVHTLTPKAGLIGMVAAWLTRVPVRFHTFQGEVWSNKSGSYRLILKLMDCLVGRFATTLTVVSKTERDFLIKEGVISAAKSSVLLNGSLSGVNLKRFKYSLEQRKRVRSSLGIDSNQLVFIYVGRINPEKGIVELLMAFKELKRISNNIQLLIIGVDEDNFLKDFLSENEELRGNLIFVPYSSKPENYMTASDVLVLPSHREGFGMVIIEAAAVGIPSIGSDIYGIQDAIVDGETGLLFQKNNISDLLDKMKYFVDYPASRIDMGIEAKKRVQQCFNQKDLVKMMVAYYHSLLYPCD